MAYCPKCAGVLDTAAVVCPHCDYDFPAGNPNPGRGFAYSPLANLALFVGMFATGFGCLAAVVVSIGALFDGHWFTALIAGPFAFFLQLAMLVVFVRVQRL
jgi:hypothetical protein